MSQLSKKLTGTGVAMVTPFKKDGSVDFSSLGKLTDHIVKDGCEYLVPLGTTGESATLNTKEKVAILEYIKERNNNRIPIVLGLGGNNTMEVINEFRNFNFIGISAILSVSPAYNKPTQAGIYQHYKMIAAESPVPVILYNVPGRTASNMTAETTLSLAHDVKNIIGIKEASGKIDFAKQIRAQCGESFLLLSGDDATYDQFMAAGGDGVISVASHLLPEVMAKKTATTLENKYTVAPPPEILFSIHAPQPSIPQAKDVNRKRTGKNPHHEFTKSAELGAKSKPKLVRKNRMRSNKAGIFYD